MSHNILSYLMITRPRQSTVHPNGLLLYAIHPYAAGKLGQLLYVSRNCNLKLMLMRANCSVKVCVWCELLLMIIQSQHFSFLLESSTCVETTTTKKKKIKWRIYRFFCKDNMLLELTL